MAAQPLTYESVLEMIRESSRGSSREIQEMRRLMQERGAEFDRRMQKTDLQIERASKEVGKLGNSIGRIVEHMLGERIIEKFQALGYGVTHPVRRSHSFENTKLGISGEFDLTLVDSDVIILIEVKTTLETSDVRKHIEKIEKYHRHIVSVGFIQPPFTHLLPSTRFFGAVAGAVVEEEAMEFAHENGLYVIAQSGEAVEIVPVPEGFKAREW
jgi:hypothetical protein